MELYQSMEEEGVCAIICYWPSDMEERGPSLKQGWTETYLDRRSYISNVHIPTPKLHIENSVRGSGSTGAT